MTYLKNINEKQNRFICFIISLLGVLFRIVIVFLIAFGLYYAAAAIHQDLNTPPLIETVEAKELHFDQDEHMKLRYYVDEQEYTRFVLKSTVELVSGTARDYGMEPNHLLGICLQEGVEFHEGKAYGCSPTAVGDQGRAIGAFQILAKYHGIPINDAKHLYFSAKWTAERMLRNGYKEDPKWAIQTHNSRNLVGRIYADKVWQIARTLQPI